MAMDTRPLTDSVDRAALSRYRRSLPPEVRPSAAGIAARTVLLVVLPGTLLAMWLSLLDGTLIDDGRWDWALTGLLLPYVAVPVVGVVLLVRSIWIRQGLRQFRLSRFAEANGFGYEAHAGPRPYPGMVFTRQGRSKEFVADVLRRRTGSVVEIGNHTCVTGSGRNATRHRWGYAAMRLPTSLPHIVLDSLSNNSLRRPRLPVAFAAQQRLSLEGDFDRHFALYCPNGYEADALYLFSPEIMAIFIDSVKRLDVEIVDDHLFLYSPGQLSTLDPEKWEEVMSTLEILGDRLARWERWRDERLVAESSTRLGPAPGFLRTRSRGVAMQGRRLSLREDWWWIIGAIFALVGFGSLIRDFVEWLTR